jgi:hypothetical protein
MANMALMAEPDPAADEFIAPTHSESVAAPTAAVPDADRQSWRATWRQAAAILLGALALAGAIVLVFWVLTPASKGVQPPVSTLPTSTSTATASATHSPPPTIASTPDQDNAYVQALKDRGISFANPDAAIYNGKLVCENMRIGMTVPQIVAAFRASNPALGADADNYVSISVHAYCPQNGNLVSGP